MNGKVEVDVIRRVFDEHSDGAHIEIGPWPDAPDTALELRTGDGKDSVDYYGQINLTMSLKFARRLGEALIAASHDKRDGDKSE